MALSITHSPLASLPHRILYARGVGHVWHQRVCTSPQSFKYTALDSDHYLGKILSAKVYDVCIETPLQHAPTLSKDTGNTISLKREDMQPVFSFKLRGAYNKIAHLTKEQLDRGIVACSAGNHAQGVAYSASKLKIDAKIVMPLATPEIKLGAVRKFGGAYGRVKLHGRNYDECQAEALRLVEEEGRTLIHPFDDPLVIAGQGTIGLEILKHSTGKPLDAIFCCVGGGGMVAGIAAYVKNVRPSVKVFGVEAEDAASMTKALELGRRITLEEVGIFADGAAVRTAGEETFRLCSDLVDGMITVNTDEICAAIKDGFNDTRCIMEPAGALAVAGMKKYIQQTASQGCHYVAVTSGANMDFDRLRFVSERADSTENLLSIQIQERPGSFSELYSLIFPHNVTEFSYRWAKQSHATIYISFQSTSAADSEATIDRLRGAGYPVMNLNGNEMAKAHARHLSGGRAPTVSNEVLYRFEFPEFPGALKKFLDELNAGWNVSLFHYRNHGADVGRVLVGLQVPDESKEDFADFLRSLGYKHWHETNNIIYRQFLC